MMTNLRILLASNGFDMTTNLRILLASNGFDKTTNLRILLASNGFDTTTNLRILLASWICTWTYGDAISEDPLQYNVLGMVLNFFLQKLGNFLISEY